MMLKDKQGRTVIIRVDRRERHLKFQKFQMLARDGLDMVPVDEAIISEGDDIFLSEEQVANMLSQTGFKVDFRIELNDEYNPVQVNMRSENKGTIFSNRSVANFRTVFYIDNRIVDEETYDKVSDKLMEIRDFAVISCLTVFLTKSVELTYRQAMELIGVGKTVTMESLNRGCAVGEERPRLLPGDSVTVKVRGKDALGVVKNINSKIVVLRQDGTKMSCAYGSVTRTDTAGYNEDLANQLDLTIRENFDSAVESSKTRIYRAKLEKSDFVFPMFPDKDRWGRDEQQVKMEGIMSCSCPVCGWRMADIGSIGSFQCCYCRIVGMVITRSDKEVSLLMSRIPGKNRFAIKEAKCCGNCGRFTFEVGREGKRSTGYCDTANQCLQAFNVCNLWYPRELSRYESNIRQHITNLHYGVDDSRNTNRNDIRDTVYTEEDHAAEVKRAEVAKIAYANAYQRFLQNLRDAAAEAPLVESVQEVTEHWQKVLSDPC